MARIRQSELRALREQVQRIPRPRLPAATYRLQFHAGFGFHDACRIVAYLRDLGVTDVYASPYLRARSGSTHGYDVADPNQLNPELGGEADFRDLVAELERQGLGQLVDVVPNHMGIGDPGNVRWLDVLENGPASIYAHFFDINWQPLRADPRDHGRLVLPVLGDQYGVVLEDGQLTLRYADGAFEVGYYDHRFPIAPDTYPAALQPCVEHLVGLLGSRHEHSQELASILTALRHLPPREHLSPEAQEERNREKEIVKRRLRLLHSQSSVFREALEQALTALNGTAGQRASFDRLDALLDEQSYRLAFWRVASEEINYRRFFDIHELAAVRMEDPEVFRATHRLLLRLVEDGVINGLRIDHPDGLLDPEGYFWRLQRSLFVRYYARRLRTAGADGAGDDLEERLGALYDAEQARDPRSPLLRAFYVVVEKILSAGEELRSGWPVHGTTGYDYLNALNGIFVDRSARRAFDALYARFIGNTRDFHDIANSTRKMVMLISLASEVNELSYLLKQLASSDRRHRDFTLNSLAFVIREIIAELPVYRTYINPGTGAMTQADRDCVVAAVEEARRRNPRTDPSIFRFVRDTLLGVGHAPVEGQRDQALRFVAKFQQATGPVMAKGLEDTAFYIYNRLVSLNEVGGEPSEFGHSVAAFHRFNQRRARDWPAALLATSTHDTKRSEDVRARINVLSEMPREWRAALTRWRRLNAQWRTAVEGRQAPDRNEEYLLYQALLGMWPLEPPDGAGLGELADRLTQFMLKAAREAKVNTSWITPNAAYESALEAFIRGILGTQESPFLTDFASLRDEVAHFGIFNALSQTLLKLASPGVPDLYQGNELWDFSLVDPDNRRPVDYALRERLLADLRARATAADPLGLEGRRVDGGSLADLCGDLLDARQDGRVKQYVTYRALALRRALPAVFAAGRYVPLTVNGQGRDIGRHVCAFAREAEGQVVVTAVPLLVRTLVAGARVAPLGESVWRDARLAVPGGAGAVYVDAFSGAHLRAEDGPAGRATLPLRDVFGSFPLALLVAER